MVFIYFYTLYLYYDIIFLTRILIYCLEVSKEKEDAARLEVESSRRLVYTVSKYCLLNLQLWRMALNKCISNLSTFK